MALVADTAAVSVAFFVATVVCWDLLVFVDSGLLDVLGSLLFGPCFGRCCRCLC